MEYIDFKAWINEWRNEIIKNNFDDNFNSIHSDNGDYSISDRIKAEIDMLDVLIDKLNEVR